MKSHLILASCLLAIYPPELLASCIETLQQETPSSDFMVEQELVIHKKTGLMWARCSLGYEWNKTQSTCDYDPVANQAQFTWQDALSQANKVKLGGRSGWRLPNKNELMSIADHACTGPATNETIFPNTPTVGSYWTSSPYGNELDNVWRVIFTTGDLLSESVSTKLFVRLVREP